MTSATPKPRAGEHTPAPWRVSAFDGDTVVVTDGAGEATVATCLDTGFVFLRQANARRIVACVNACDGYPTEGLEMAIPGSFFTATNTIAERDALKALNAELANMLTWHTNHEGECLGDHPELLEAARAVLAKVRT